MQLSLIETETFMKIINPMDYFKLLFKLFLKNYGYCKNPLNNLGN